MKRLMQILVLMLWSTDCFGQVNYVLYRTSSNTNAYNIHTLPGCSATITSVPFDLEWSAADGYNLTSDNYTLSGYYGSTDYCTKRTSVSINCDMSKLEGGVRYSVPFDVNGIGTYTDLRNGIAYTSNYANGLFTVGITPQRPIEIFKSDMTLVNIEELFLTQDEPVYLCTKNDKVTFPNTSYTYEIDWRADNNDTWKTISSYPFKVPYDTLTQPTKEGRKIYLRSRTIRGAGSSTYDKSFLKLTRSIESSSSTGSTSASNDDPVKYSPYYDIGFFMEVRKKIDVV